MSRWRKLLALSREERALLVRAVALLVYARLRLPHLEFRPDSADAPRASGIGEAPEAFDGGPASPAAQEGRPGHPSATLAHARRVARMVGIAADHGPLRVTCLHRSLVLWWLLRRHGIPCALRVGVNSGTGTLEAHAWVECGGSDLDASTGLYRFRPFARAVVPVGFQPPGFGQHG